ncbi:CRIB domain-containing protein RIC4-like isoform X1 [Lycium barbarum]|uniref:CRIB domain-containing protein RIC4-like isoform X1 n=1 Tax=Lycium barbarum TaxID=112863 RepID=UPI00293EE7C9|nr:CRIB domain-containing protein RIC4-like isoform X1 [Lycium barbarum]
MRDRMEKFVLLPFSVGCISESSVAIGPPHHKIKSSPEVHLTPTKDQQEREEEEEEDDKILEGENLKSLMALPRFQRLLKNFKNLSHLFVEKDEMEEEMGIEIGSPTDVKHVTHIGIDGAATSILSRSWEHLKTPDFLTLSSFPFSHSTISMPPIN